MDTKGKAAVKFGLFQTPFSPPERSPREVFNWAVSQAVAAEEAGLSEFWVGQHFTLAWEAIPSPELVLAAAARETERIVLAPGAHIPPYAHPASLASQTAWMSNILEGRYILGVATGVNPVDGQLHGFADMKRNLEMTVESLDIMEKIWSGEPFDYKGKYWCSSFPAQDDTLPPLRYSRPYGGQMTIAIGGASPNSTSIKVGGRRGLIPLSFGANPALVKNHWDTYSAAAREAGRTDGYDRTIHHVTMDVFVADTDAEAERIAIEGPIAKAWRGHLIPNEQRRAARAGTPPVWSLDDDMRDIVRKHMIVGSPETVIEKLSAFVEASNGWGTTLIFGHDFSDDPAPWNYSMELLAKEVGPKVGLDVK